MKEAKGQDLKSLDKVLAALVKFEESTHRKPFKQFHVEQAGKFKTFLGKATGPTGKPLSLTTVDATLRLVKGFFHWLAGQQGFKKVLSYSDVEYFNYFNNNRNDARAAHAHRVVQPPSLEPIMVRQTVEQAMAEHIGKPAVNELASIFVFRSSYSERTHVKI